MVFKSHKSQYVLAHCLKCLTSWPYRHSGGYDSVLPVLLASRVLVDLWSASSLRLSPRIESIPSLSLLPDLARVLSLLLLSQKICFAAILIILRSFAAVAAIILLACRTAAYRRFSLPLPSFLNHGYRLSLQHPVNQPIDLDLSATRNCNNCWSAPT